MYRFNAILEPSLVCFTGIIKLKDKPLYGALNRTEREKEHGQNL
jgi:hypothetical protein